jgi:hypothetical protein
MVASAGTGQAVADELGSDPLMRRDPYRTNDLATRRASSQVRRAPTSNGLYDVLDLILDKGIVVDAFVRVSLVGIELLTVDLRVVIASVDTYLRYAEGIERLNVRGDERTEPATLPGMVGKGVKAHTLSKGAEKITHALGGGDDEEEDDDRGDEGGHGVAGALSKGVRNVVGKLLGGDEGEEDDDARARRKRDSREQERRHTLPGRERREGERRPPARAGGGGRR